MVRLARRQHPQTGRRVLSGITRTGVWLCAPAAVVGLILLAIGHEPGEPIESVHGDIGMGLVLFGLIGPFALWSVHLAVEQWVDEAGEFFEGRYTRPVTIAASAAFGCLALGLFALALMPVLALVPDDGPDLWAELLLLIMGAICLAVLVSAIAGGVVLFGWRGAVVGALTGLGFSMLVVGGLIFGTTWTPQIGIALLVAGTAGFWGLRMLER